MTGLIRLNKHLALQLGISRREADEMIEKGLVTVDDAPVTLGARISEHNDVKVRGDPIARGTPYRYVAFHKPVGYVCSRRRQGEIPTIYELLPGDFHTLKPVGRLDKDSSGILLLSNDGDFTFTMTHPKFAKQKRYDIVLDQPLQPLHQQMISDYGVALPDGTSQLQLTRQDDSRLLWEVSMHEGRNRQIRRTFAALGYTVIRLHRVQFGPYQLHDLPAGTYQVLPRP